MKKTAIAIALSILGLPATGRANTLLVLTENSSSSLTANIGTVVNVSPNNWDWIPPAGSAQTINAFTTYWLEPESTGGTTLGNFEGFGATYNGQGAFKILSDFDFTGTANPSVPNGTTLVDHLVTDVGTHYDVQFFDNGDVAAVPEPSSLLLLGTGLLGLVGSARRKWLG